MLKTRLGNLASLVVILVILVIQRGNMVKLGQRGNKEIAKQRRGVGGVESRKSASCCRSPALECSAQSAVFEWLALHVFSSA